MSKPKHIIINWNFLVKVLLIIFLELSLFKNVLFSQTPYLLDDPFTNSPNINWNTSGAAVGSVTYYGRLSKSVEFAGSGDRISLKNDLSGSPDKIFFSMLSRGGAGAVYSIMTLEEATSNAGPWSVVGTYSTNATITAFSANLQLTTKRVRFTMTTFNGGYSIYLDDVRVVSSGRCSNRNPDIFGVIINGGCAAGNCENDNEMVMFKTGNRSLHLDSLEIVCPSGTGGSAIEWSIGGQGTSGTLAGTFTWSSLTAAEVLSLNTAAGCTMFFVVPASKIIPANARVYAYTGSNIITTYNFSGACGTSPIYVIKSSANDCTVGGKYPNSNCGGGPTCDRSTTVINHGCGCLDTKSYNSNSSTSNDGAYVYFTPIATAVNTAGCAAYAPLPISLLDFYATKNYKTNELVWKVAQEKNILYYTIEKSKDAIDFTELATVYPNNSIHTKSYSVFDSEPYRDITYYRLSTKEVDGTSKNYKIISVNEADNKWEYIHYQTENNLVLEFKNALPKNSVISLYDISGKELISQAIKHSQTTLDTEILASGVYFVRLATPYKTEHFKIIITK